MCPFLWTGGVGLFARLRNEASHFTHRIGGTSKWTRYHVDCC